MPNDIKSHSMPNFRVKNLIERFGSHRMGQFREDPNHAKNHEILCLMTSKSHSIPNFRVKIL